MPKNDERNGVNGEPLVRTSKLRQAHQKFLNNEITIEEYGRIYREVVTASSDNKKP